LTSGPLRAVAFDWAGVLTSPPFAGLAEYERELGVPPGSLCREFRGGRRFREVELGRQAVGDMLRKWRDEIEATYSVKVSLRRVITCFQTAAVLNDDMVDLVSRIGLRRALITNNIAESRQAWQGDLPPALFDVLIDSSDVGARKPDPEIFAVLVDRLGVAPADVLLVDDFEENVDGARAAGLQAIHFIDPPSCQSALAALGVPIQARLPTKRPGGGP